MKLWSVSMSWHVLSRLLQQQSFMQLRQQQGQQKRIQGHSCESLSEASRSNSSNWLVFSSHLKLSRSSSAHLEHCQDAAPRREFHHAFFPEKIRTERHRDSIIPSVQKRDDSNFIHSTTSNMLYKHVNEVSASPLVVFVYKNPSD